MDENLSIRIAKKSDADFLAKLSGEFGYPTTTIEMENRLEKLLLRTDNIIYVAELDIVAGWIHLAIIQHLESSVFVEICGLVVSEQHRNKGIGRKLIAKGESWVKNNGFNHIRVRTNILRDQTREFYRKVGFQPKKMQEVFDKMLSTVSQIN
jgi:GNAT superfamily N-acetyltransferase